MADTINPNIDTIPFQAFEALVAKGVYCLLFPLKVTGGNMINDTTENLLNGIPIGNITIGDETPEQEEFQDQLAGGLYKTFAGGSIDPGDLNLTSYFAPGKPPLKIQGVVNSTVIIPQFTFIAAVQDTDPMKLQAFFAAGVNYNGGQGIQGDFGKIIKSNLKFKISGKPLRGFQAAGKLDKSLYGPITESNTTLASNLSASTDEAIA